jgi:DNA-binding IclR family transcriptional regulator
VDELELGLTAAAAPIRSAHGDIIASMSISGPTFRLTYARLDETIPQVVAAALEVSHRLGWGRRS